MQFIPRHLMSKISAATPPRAVAVFGPRRIGKTTMLEHLVGTQAVKWYSGDSPRTASALDFQSADDVRNALLQASTIVIDDAHKIQNIGNIVKMMVDANEHLANPTRIFITSSSPFYLASVKESALGRVASRQMWPFSLSEIADFTSWGNVNDNIGRFLVYGTMPRAYNSPEDARDYLEDYKDGLLLNDLLEETPVRQTAKLKELLWWLAHHVGSEVTADNLAKEIGLSRVTVEDYLAKLERASIIRICYSYSKNVANELKKGKKIYFFDNGIRNALIKDFSPLAERSDVGALWENFFFMERTKLHDTARDYTEIYFWRTTGLTPREIDFVEVKNQKVLRAFECKFSPKATTAKGKEKFLAAYPGCDLQIVHPSDCMKIFRTKG